MQTKTYVLVSLSTTYQVLPEEIGEIIFLKINRSHLLYYTNNPP
jgi:hypothetical protein